MFIVTEGARDRLLSKIVAKKAAGDESLRITRRNGRWHLRVDQPKDGDETFSHENRTVLLLDEKVSRALSRMTLDLRDDLSKPRLRLRKDSH